MRQARSRATRRALLGVGLALASLGFGAASPPSGLSALGPWARASDASGCPSQVGVVPEHEHCVSWPATVVLVPTGPGGCAGSGGGSVQFIDVPLASGGISEENVDQYVALWNYDQPNQNPPPGSPWVFTTTGGPNGTGSGPYGQPWSTTSITSGTLTYPVPRGDGAWLVSGGGGCGAASTVTAYAVVSTCGGDMSDAARIAAAACCAADPSLVARAKRDPLNGEVSLQVTATKLGKIAVCGRAQITVSLPDGAREFLRVKESHGTASAHRELTDVCGDKILARVTLPKTGATAKREVIVSGPVPRVCKSPKP
ncbi:MAG TPA: hypothetical protein VMA77_34855 [Solirubrobacteraceae bacterium]|nr:hypothetical protein [Solirubrobacteraceae bacterium]